MAGLPIELTSFVGRRSEMAWVLGAIREAHLVTLTGPGGAGKTRLATHAAAQMRDEFDDVVLVELAPVAAPDVVTTVAEAADVRTDGELEPRDAIARSLGARNVLLVLDNCEHVIDEATDLVARVLGHASALRIVATSREPLGLPAERVLTLDALSLPPSDDVTSLEKSDAVRLFAERARAVRPTFDVTEDNAAAVAAICGRLDGLPLAIELAAAKTAVLAPAQIADRLDQRFALLRAERGRPDRQSTLDALCDWSWRLLDETQRAVLRRLAVFPGRFTIEAAEAVVAGGPVDQASVLDVVGALVTRSLVAADDRGVAVVHSLLETIRIFARAQLDASGEADAVSAQHLAWCQSDVADAAALLSGPRQIEALARMSERQDDVRAAIHWASAHGRHVEALRLAAGFADFWVCRGLIADARATLTDLLEHASDAPDALRADALLAVAALAETGADHEAVAEALDCAEPLIDADALRARARVIRARAELTRGNMDAAERCATEASELAERTGADRLRAGALNVLGYAMKARGDSEGEARVEESLTIARRVGEPASIASALTTLGGIAREHSRITRARDLYSEAREIWLELGHKRNVSSVLNGLGTIAAISGALEEAIACYEESIETSSAIGAAQLEAEASTALANVYHWKGRLPEAARTIDRALALSRERDLRGTLANALSIAGSIALDEGSSDRAEACLAEALEVSREIGHRWGEANALIALGNVAWTLGDLDAAERWWAETVDVQSAIGYRDGVGYTKANLGVLMIERGDLAGGSAELEEAATIASDVADERLRSFVLAGQSLIARKEGRLDDAEALEREALAIRRAGEPPLVAMSLHALGGIAADRGDARRACVLLAAAERARHESGSQLGAVEGRRWTADVAAARAAEMSWRDAWDDPLPLDEAVATALGTTRATALAATPPERDAAFVCEGDVWQIEWRGENLRVKDSKGMQALAVLLAQPHVEIHSLDLVGATDDVGRALRHQDAAPLIDAAARDAYRGRLDELREELAEAEAFNDSARAARARAEIDAITDELSRALGLGGRIRVAGSAAEKARQNANRTIKAAVERIEEHCPSLARHLRAYVRTGTFSVYQPDPDDAPRWQL